jgi:hypothetical protein
MKKSFMEAWRLLRQRLDCRLGKLEKTGLL